MIGRQTTAAGSSRRPVRAGIIGPGGIGTVHCAALRAIGVEVAAVASSSAPSAHAHAARLNIPLAYDDPAGLIASSDVDVVHICTPNDMHAPLAHLALAAGKHVVCEKPLATNVDDARDLQRLAAGSGLISAVCYCYRYYTLPRLMRAWTAAGALGRVHLIHGAYLLDEVLLLEDGRSWMLDPARIGPSLSLADIGVHWWDLVEYVGGRRITEVICAIQRARASDPDTPGLDDSDAVLFRLDDGAIASAVIAQTAPGHTATLALELIGTRASAAWNQEDADHLRFGPLAAPPRLVSRTEAQAELEPPRVPYRPSDQPQDAADVFRHLMADVYAHIEAPAGAPAAYPTFADGARGVEVLAALLTSARERRWVSV